MFNENNRMRYGIFITKKKELMLYLINVKTDIKFKQKFNTFNIILYFRNYLNNNRNEIIANILSKYVHNFSPF